MTCNACKYEFCWLCMQKFTSNHYQNNPTNPCAGRMFTDREFSKCRLCCLMCYGILLYLFFPIILIFILIFILPIYYFFQTYSKIRTRTIQVNRMHPHDNRFQERDRNQALDQIGRCNLFGYCLLSILVFPLVLLILSIPLIIILLLWFIFLFIVIYRNIYVMCKLCFSSSPNPIPANQNAPVLRPTERQNNNV